MIQLERDKRAYEAYIFNLTITQRSGAQTLNGLILSEEIEAAEKHLADIELLLQQIEIEAE